VLQLRIFLSSPSDVAAERAAARKVLDELPRGHLLKGRVGIDVVAYDDPLAPAPMEAGVTPQDSVNRYSGTPSECDLTVVILWSRLGTRLPEHKRKPDGTRYNSGTEWEFEDAMTAKRPVWLYRCTAKPKVELDDPEFDAKRQQYEGVKRFFSQFRAEDGSLVGGINSYDTPAAFAEQFRQHLEAFINERLARPSQGEPDQAAVDPRAQAALAALRGQVKKGDACTLTEAELHLVLSHPPRSLEVYRARCIARWSRSRYAIDKRFTPLTLLVDRGEDAQGDRYQKVQREFNDLREVLKAVDPAHEPVLVVTGAPGGKSTLFRRLELDLACDAMRCARASRTHR
jgi:hypothetical protein